MAYLVGVAGLAGAGKTTAVQYLAQVTGGQAIYLGEIVLQEVRARGLPETRENERLVRLELRREEGPGVLAMRHKEGVIAHLARGTPVFVDAIFLQAEFEVLRSCAPDASAQLLAIRASFDIRLARLSIRPDRQFTHHELVGRDKTELETLGTGDVIEAANRTIRNEESLSGFYRRLAEFLSSCPSTQLTPR